MATLSLINGIVSAYSTAKNPLLDHTTVQVCSTCVLTNEEIKAFDSAMAFLYKGLQADGMYPPDHRAIIYFITEDTLSLRLSDPLTFGVHASIIIYPVGRWRAKSASNNEMIVAMLEELCHCFYNIYDEYAVKEQVTALIRPFYPNMTLESIYAGFNIPDPSA